MGKEGGGRRKWKKLKRKEEGENTEGKGGGGEWRRSDKQERKGERRWRRKMEIKQKVIQIKGRGGMRRRKTRR